MKQIFLDYTKKYRRGGGAKQTMSPKCECCTESPTERTKLVRGTRISPVMLSLCYKCASFSDQEIWTRMTNKLMQRILASHNGK